MSDEPTDEEIQRIATICGELSFADCGILQHRAVFPAWHGDDGELIQAQQIMAVPPERVEGIYQNIYLRLKQTEAYQPLAEMERRAQNSERDVWRLRAEADKLRLLVAEAEHHIAHLTGQGDTDWRTEFRNKAPGVTWYSRLDGWKS
jgi:hypothetical protein